MFCGQLLLPDGMPFQRYFTRIKLVRIVYPVGSFDMYPDGVDR